MCLSLAITGWQKCATGHCSLQPCLDVPLTLAAAVREDGENEDDFGGRGVAAHTGSGFQWGF